MTVGWFARLPNFISIARLVLAPVVIDTMVSGRWRVAFFIFRLDRLRAADRGDYFFSLDLQWSLSWLLGAWARGGAALSPCCIQVRARLLQPRGAG